MAADDSLPSSSSPLSCDSASPRGRHHVPLALFAPEFIIILVLLSFFLIHFFCDDLRDYFRRCFLRFRAALSSWLSPPPRAKQGLDGTILESFSVFLYGKEKGKMGLDCSVCLSDFEEGEEVRLLTVCCHAFHVCCIDRWLSEHTTCPVCRSDLTIPPDVMPVFTVNEVVDSHVIAVTEKTDTDTDTDILMEWMDGEQRPLQSDRVERVQR